MNSSSSPLASIHLLCQVALMSALIAIGGVTHIPLGAVPITLQDFFVAIAGGVLGSFRSLWAVGLYVLAGLAGMPVFSGGKGGIAVLFGPTGGYIVGFFFVAFCSGLGVKNLYTKKKFPVFSIATGALLGFICLYTCGIIGLMLSLHFSFLQAVSVGVLPFIPALTIKLFGIVIVLRVLYRSHFIVSSR